MAYCIEFSAIKSRPLRDVLNNLQVGSTGIQLSKLAVRDLTHFKRKPIVSGRGVYLFYDAGRPAYIGLAGSRSFVERIPAHLDPTAKGWFNTLLRRIVDDRMGKRESPRALEEAAKIARRFRLRFVNFPTRSELCVRQMKLLEKTLIAHFDPEFNRMSEKTMARYAGRLVESKSVTENLRRLR